MMPTTTRRDTTIAPPAPATLTRPPRPPARASTWRVAPRRLAALARAHPYTMLILAMGLLLRAMLLPLGHGDDFTVWDLAARYTLAGVNIYQDHPPYPGGPYAYFPLFLYVELPLRWLALHGGIPFTVLGKLPIVAGDLLTGGTIALLLARRGLRDRGVALGAALYLWNPLVLYNGAYYGRFDALCAGLLLLALAARDNADKQPHPLGALGRIAIRPYTSRPPSYPPGAPASRRQAVAGERVDDGARRRHVQCRLDAGAPGGYDDALTGAGAPGGYDGGRRDTSAPSRYVAPAESDAAGWRRWAFPLLYALAVATKSYPIFLLPWLLAREPHGRKRLLLALAGVLGGLSLPYLLTSPARFVADILLYDAHKTPGHLSWQTLPLAAGLLSPHAARLLSYGLLLLFVAALYRCRRLDLWTYCAASILLFILLSKVVIEQYFLWPLPFLILDALDRRSQAWAAWGLLAVLTAAGMLANAHIYPFGESPWPLVLLLTASIVLYLADLYRGSRRAAVL